MASCTEKTQTTGPVISNKDSFRIVRQGTPEDVEQMILTLGKGAAAKMRERSRGMTLLMAAAQSTRHPQVIRLLLGAGCSLSAKDSRGLSPLLLAARDNPNGAVFQALLDGGAYIGTTDHSGMTVVRSLTTGTRSLEVLKVLLDRGVDPDEILHNTDQPWDNAPFLSKLLAKGARPTPKQLDTITENTSLDVIQALARSRVFPRKLPSTVAQRLVLHHPQAIQILQSLIRNSPKWYIFQWGKDLLETIANNGKSELLEFLLKQGDAIPTPADRSEWIYSLKKLLCWRHMSCRCPSEEIVAMLLPKWKGNELLDILRYAIDTGVGHNSDARVLKNLLRLYMQLKPNFFYLYADILNIRCPGKDFIDALNENHIMPWDQKDELIKLIVEYPVSLPGAQDKKDGGTLQPNSPEPASAAT